MIADVPTHMSKTIEVWWIRWGGDAPCIVGERVVRTILPGELPSVWFSKQEAVNFPYIHEDLRQRFEVGLPDNQWELVSTQIEFTEEELNEAIHH